jgi:hypothetical protein
MSDVYPPVGDCHADAPASGATSRPEHHPQFRADREARRAKASATIPNDFFSLHKKNGHG